MYFNNALWRVILEWLTKQNNGAGLENDIMNEGGSPWPRQLWFSGGRVRKMVRGAEGTSSEEIEGWTKNI